MSRHHRTNQFIVQQRPTLHPLHWLPRSAHERARLVQRSASLPVHVESIGVSQTSGIQCFQWKVACIGMSGQGRSSLLLPGELPVLLGLWAL